MYFLKNLTILILLCPMSTLVMSQNEIKKMTRPEVPSLSITKHQGTFGGVSMKYTATTGYYVVEHKDGKGYAKLFFIAYTKDDVADPATRPVTFTFNGGPGSSSVWLHMGGLGPKRILMNSDGSSLAPPYKVVDNEYAWLNKSDMVFIDPMMTGITRPAEGSMKEDFIGYENDIQLVGDFIRLYTSRNARWNSPKFLAGESYGTTRAAGLSSYLLATHGMYLNGIMMISAVFNFQTLSNDPGNDLPYPLIIPTMAATKWYHTPENERNQTLMDLLNEVESFVDTVYAPALFYGNQYEIEEERLIDDLSKYTGLSTAYLRLVNYRPYVAGFTSELLKPQRLQVGRLDGRFTGFATFDGNGSGGLAGDPSYSRVIYGPFTMAVNDHIKRTLKFDSDMPYDIISGEVRPWKYPENRYLNVAENLKLAMINNPFMKVWIANGYYDMATPYYATRYTVDHMFLPPEIEKNILMTYYEAGHMMYIDTPSLKKFTQDFNSFIEKAISQK